MRGCGHGKGADPWPAEGFTEIEGFDDGWLVIEGFPEIEGFNDGWLVIEGFTEIEGFDVTDG